MIPASVHAISGAVGSSLANLTLFPLDVAIVRAQVERENQKADYENVVMLIKKILSCEGWGAFFEGAGDDLAATALQSFLYFLVYNSLRNRQLRRSGFSRHGMLSISGELFYGAVAGVVCKLFTTPIKNIVLLKQLHATSQSTIECIKQIYNKRGVAGFWAGYRATFFLSINPSLAYYFYQLMGSKYKQSAIRVFLRAALAKSLALILTYPVILAKTRSQADDKAARRGILKELYLTLRYNGIAGLYDGAEGQLVKGIFMQGITMTTKESIENFVLNIYRARRL